MKALILAIFSMLMIFNQYNTDNKNITMTKISIHFRKFISIFFFSINFQSTTYKYIHVFKENRYMLINNINIEK